MRWLCGVALLFSLAGCGRDADIAARDAPPEVQGDSAAIAACADREEYHDTTLRAAFDTTVGQLKTWLDSRQPAEWGHVVLEYERDRSDADPMSLCWVDDGSLAFPSPAAVEGRPRAALVIDAGGDVFFLVGGYFETTDSPELEIERPTRR